MRTPHAHVHRKPKMKTVNVLVGKCLTVNNNGDKQNEIMLSDKEGVVYIGKTIARA